MQSNRNRAIHYHHRYDGEFTDVTDGEFVACCDCGLVHEYDYKVVDGRILRRGWRCNRDTANRRRRKEVRASIWRLKAHFLEQLNEQGNHADKQQTI